MERRQTLWISKYLEFWRYYKFQVVCNLTDFHLSPSRQPQTSVQSHLKKTISKRIKQQNKQPWTCFQLINWWYNRLSKYKVLQSVYTICRTTLLFTPLNITHIPETPILQFLSITCWSEIFVANYNRTSAYFAARVHTVQRLLSLVGRIILL